MISKLSDADVENDPIQSNSYNERVRERDLKKANVRREKLFSVKSRCLQLGKSRQAIPNRFLFVRERGTMLTYAWGDYASCCAFAFHLDFFFVNWLFCREEATKT
jgi:hypothetical protein